MLMMSDATGWASGQPTLGILAGLAMLVVGAEVLVRGAVWIALTLGMSRMAVGLTLVAIGTSLPELLVSFTAVQDGEAGMGISNVLGSNAANILLIVGAAAAIRSIRVHTRWLELGYLLLLSAVAAVPFALEGRLDRWLSGAMVGVLTLFLWQLLARERAARRLADAEPRQQGSLGGWLVHFALLAAGFVMLKFGADWLVDGSVAIAKSLEMSTELIGMTVVAVGTSLPELATSVVAALRGQPEICIGNVVGSNIFNIGAVLGVTGLLQPFVAPVEPLLPLLVISCVATVVLIGVLKAKGGIGRAVGVLFLLAYFGFMTWQVMTSKSS
ncbi:MAG: calcium/sodium antiporter [Planctomycetes bacterium]|nr:calcium/sodium antiporter [Planctomycetota bacterium]